MNLLSLLIKNTKNPAEAKEAQLMSDSNNCEYFQHPEELLPIYPDNQSNCN